MFRIQLARLGQTMEQGTVVRWLKQAGDNIEIGEELYEVETEKTIVPIQATRRGQLVSIVAPEGTTLAVGDLLAIVAEVGEQPTPAQVDALVRSDPEQPVVEQPIATDASAAAQASSGAQRVAALPKARTLARELNVDLAGVKGTGPEGIITPDDVRKAAAGSGTAGNVSPAQARVARKAPLTAVQRTTIRALEKGWQVPQFTQSVIIDATALANRKNAAAGALSYLDFFLDALVQAARQLPEVLARIKDEEIVYYQDIDMTIATATDRGLLVPVVRNAGALDLAARHNAWKAITDRARAGQLSADEMSGGLIALSNLGTRGVDYGTALLPAGHAAIAFFGGLELRALVVDGKVEARPSVHVSITYDHRIIDGVLGSRFTAAVKAALEA